MRKIYILLLVLAVCAINFMGCKQDNMSTQTQNHVDLISLQELIQQDAPNKMIFWLNSNEYIIEDAIVIEQLWMDLRNKSGKEETLEPRIEGGYALECFYGDEIVTLVVDGYGIYIDGQRYAVGEELANWTENLYNAAGVERYLD